MIATWRMLIFCFVVEHLLTLLFARCSCRMHVAFPGDAVARFGAVVAAAASSSRTTSSANIIAPRERQAFAVRAGVAKRVWAVS